ncbi:MAG: DNA polymerase Y family protein [Verrucomicrobiota bacterium]
MYLRIHIENFALAAALRFQPGKQRGPVALVDHQGRVFECNSAAQGKDILPGMSMAKALSRCGSLQIINQDMQAERVAKRLLWNVAWQITPQIELGQGQDMGCATLELVRPDFQKLTLQIDRLLSTLRRYDLTARAGLAETPEWAVFAAIAAERSCFKIIPNKERAQELMACLPLPVLEALSAEHCAILEGWGIHTLAALAKLPRQALGERIGQAGLQAWDILNGQEKRRLHFSEIEPDYSQRFDLEDPIVDLEGICFLIQRASESLELQLEQAGKMARSVFLYLKLENGRTEQKTIRLPEATSRADLLERLLRNYLEQLRLKAPVCVLQLGVEPVDPLSRQAGLFERSVRNPWRLQETLDQLAGLLGPDAFGCPRPSDTHHPDRFRLEALSTDEPDTHSNSSTYPEGPPEMGPPMRRFYPPLAAKVLIRKGRPVHIATDIVQGDVERCNGPYCLSGDWADKEIWALAEWDVEITQAGVYCLRWQKERWQLIGAYD